AEGPLCLPVWRGRSCPRAAPKEPLPALCDLQNPPERKCFAERKAVLYKAESRKRTGMRRGRNRRFLPSFARLGRFRDPPLHGSWLDPADPPRRTRGDRAHVRLACGTGLPLASRFRSDIQIRLRHHLPLPRCAVFPGVVRQSKSSLGTWRRVHIPAPRRPSPCAREAIATGLSVGPRETTSRRGPLLGKSPEWSSPRHTVLGSGQCSTAGTAADDTDSGRHCRMESKIVDGSDQQSDTLGFLGNTARSMNSHLS